VLVVLDAGVFVSALVTPGGTASRVVAAGVAGRFEYLLCPRLISELLEVVERPKIARLATEQVRQRFLADVLAGGRDEDDPTHVPVVSRDPDDDYLFALAQEHGAERIVTGDADLLDIADPPVPVVGVRAFLDVLTV
jgi:putative PIN family toxin of toxin-antitoxin system